MDPALSNVFANCISTVRAAFLQRQLMLNGRLVDCDIEVLFVSEVATRGSGIVRMIARSTNWNQFTDSNRFKGGRCFCSTDMYHITSEASVHAMFGNIEAIIAPHIEKYKWGNA